MRQAALISLTLVALGVVAFIPSIAAYPATIDDETLKGITSVKVFVEGVNPADKSRGVTAKQLQADVASQLRKAGIAVSADATEYLYVNVNTLQSRQRLTSFSVVVMVRQATYLVRDPSITAPAAITWWKGTDATTVTPPARQRSRRWPPEASSCLTSRPGFASVRVWCFAFVTDPRRAPCGASCSSPGSCC
jgi:hypothetical protein